jgi:hypothetical protein
MIHGISSREKGQIGFTGKCDHQFRQTSNTFSPPPISNIVQSPTPLAQNQFDDVFFHSVISAAISLPPSSPENGQRSREWKNK